MLIRILLYGETSLSVAFEALAAGSKESRELAVGFAWIVPPEAQELAHTVAALSVVDRSL